MVDPIDYSSGLSRALNSGAQLGGLISLARQQGIANQQAQRQQQVAQQFQADWQTSFGDPQKMTALAAKYPQMMEQIKQGIGFKDEQHQIALGNAARDLRIAMATGNPKAVQQAAANNAGTLGSIGSSPDEVMQQFQQDPQSLAHTVDAVGLSALGAKDYYGVENDRAQRQNDAAKLAESIRSNKAGEAIQVRGQDVSAATARRGQDMANQRANALSNAGGDGRTVQLSDGRTVQIVGKLHGAGQNAFYEGVDNAGNTVRVPASSIAAPATSAASAQNYAMSKDLGAILNAPTENLDFMTGVTGGNGSPSWGAEVRSRLGGGEQRQLFNATKRIQGKMQNQGIAAARDMGASGINTVAEAKMYFQGMPQIDYSSPGAMQESVKNIKQYTDQYNSQYNVDVGSNGQQQIAVPQGGVYTSRSGIQFKVK